MPSKNLFAENEDLQFHFHHAVDWNQVTAAWHEESDGPLNVDETRQQYEEVLSLVGEFCAREVEPRAAGIDQAGIQWKDGEVTLPEGLVSNLEGAKQLGILAVSLPKELGGWNFPFTVNAMMVEMISTACPNTLSFLAFYQSPAMMLLRFASDEIKKRYIPKLASGEISGSVAMTEPEAGSDVGALTTSAVDAGDGAWHVTGRKQFITNGCGDIALVLTRTDAHSKGLEGLSMHLVPRFIERDGKRVKNFEIGKPEHKLSLRGSPTLEQYFDNSIGYLIGEPGKGWEYILSFMNEARVAVGIQALGICQAAYRKAYDYGRQRRQMGKAIAQHELVADMLLDMDLEIRALRAMIYEATQMEDRRVGLKKLLAEGKLTEAEGRTVKQLVKKLEHASRELTPLIKYWGAEKAVEITRKALQIHGGYGIFESYEVERHLRNSVITAIYEGTSQIQALMALKDQINWAMSRPKDFLSSRLALKAAKSRAAAGTKNLLAIRDEISSSIQYLVLDILREKKKGSRMAGKDLSWIQLIRQGKSAFSREDLKHFSYALLNAERLATMFSLFHGARLLKGLADHSDDEGRATVADRYLRRREPVARSLAAQIRSGDRTTLEYIQENQ
ncbi:MAG: acyl-CoA dehydrogenase family protein [Acidobacteriia bacterium]|nr:acyl-CoA dehydrogenase family protein [Terriglobia bacterium]